MEVKNPRILLHTCCAPCSSYVLSVLSVQGPVTLYYFNPNTQPLAEYEKRLAELQKLLNVRKYENQVDLVASGYDAALFDNAVIGLENEPEGGKRCEICFTIRLRETARYANENGFEAFTTTLTVSPHKNSKIINAIGEEISENSTTKYLYADFKKKDGYKKSIELSKLYGLYRQDYCGCKYSKRKR